MNESLLDCEVDLTEFKDFPDGEVYCRVTGELRGKDDADDEALGPREGNQYGPIQLLRFANRVPLQYQQSACAIFKAVTETHFRQYGLAQPRGGLPQGPMVLLVHIASVWVPFTSESKEAVAHYPEIIRELKLALKECGRKLSVFLHQREHQKNQAKRRSIFEVYIGELVQAVARLTGTPGVAVVTAGPGVVKTSRPSASPHLSFGGFVGGEVLGSKLSVTSKAKYAE